MWEHQSLSTFPGRAHINIQKTHTNSAYSEKLPAWLSSVAPTDQNCSGPLPSELARLSQVANRQRPFRLSNFCSSAAEIKCNNSLKTWFTEIKVAGLVMRLCRPDHGLCVLARMTTCVLQKKKQKKNQDYFGEDLFWSIWRCLYFPFFSLKLFSI